MRLQGAGVHKARGGREGGAGRGNGVRGRGLRRQEGGGGRTGTHPRGNSLRLAGEGCNTSLLHLPLSFGRGPQCLATTVDRSFLGRLPDVNCLGSYFLWILLLLCLCRGKLSMHHCCYQSLVLILLLLLRC